MNDALTRPLAASLAREWAGRAQAEHEATTHFRALGAAMAEVGAPATVLAAVRAAPADETRHRDLCARLAARFGHRGRAWRSRALPVLGPAELDPVARCLWATVAMCCVTETLNVALLGEMLNGLEDSELSAVTREILSDEVRHARLGWGFIAAHRTRLDFLGRALPRILSAAAGEELPPTLALPTAPNYGLVSLQRRAELFVTSVRDVILPGLAAQGIDVTGGRDWLSTGLPEWLADHGRVGSSPSCLSCQRSASNCKLSV